MNRVVSSIAWSKPARRLPVCLPVLAATWAAATWAAGAWAVGGVEPSLLDIRLRATHDCHQSVVRLGDIAEIQTSDPAEARQLAAIELFPSPRKGQIRRVAVREIQDLLELHAVNLLKCHFHGASVVRIRASAGPTPSPRPRKKTTVVGRRRGQQLVRNAVFQYLQQQNGAGPDLTVVPQLSDAQLQILSPAVSATVTDGGQPPWPGVHDFQLRVETSVGPSSVTARVEIKRPTMVVTAVRPVRRGEVLQPSDVQLAAAPPNVRLAGYAVSLKDVVGRQTTRSLTSGQPIARQAIRALLLVRRGDVVTVMARAAGVRVRTTARALSDGSYGQLIMVQTLAGRDRYSARVVDAQEVEVYPRAISVPATSSNPPRSAR